MLHGVNLFPSFSCAFRPPPITPMFNFGPIKKQSKNQSSFNYWSWNLVSKKRNDNNNKETTCWKERTKKMKNTNKKYVIKVGDSNDEEANTTKIK